MSGSAGPCRYFLSQGKCFYGAECKFEHAAPAATATAAPATDVPASATAAPAAAPGRAPALASSKMLAAGAKSWTPSANVGSFVPASAAASAAAAGDGGLTVPAAASVAASGPSSPLPSKSPALGGGGAGLKLNPNKTPFKPGGGSSVTAAPKAQLSTAVPAFVPSSSPVALAPYTDEAETSHQDHYADDDSYHPDVDPSFAEGGDDNPYATHFAGHHNDDLHGLHQMQSMGGEDGAQLHGGHEVAAAGTYVAPDAYTTYSDFAAHSAPIRTTSTTASAPSLPRTAQQPGGGGPGLFMDDSLRARLTLWAHLQITRLQPDDPMFAALPTSLDHDRYHSLLPLPADEAPAGVAKSTTPVAAASSSSSSSAPSAAAASSWYAKTSGGSVSYKVVSAMDGRSYVIKRLLHCKLTEDTARSLLAPWISLQACYGSGSSPGSGEVALSSAWGAGASHPHIVALRGVFSSKDFGNDAASLPVGVTPPPSSAGPSQICLVYDYHPTLAVLAPLTAEGASKSVADLWNLFLQLLTALAAIHENHRAAGAMLQPGRVLATSDGRVRLSCMGLGELLGPQSAASSAGAASAQASKASELELTKAQASDIKSLALLMLGWMGFAAQASQIWGMLHPAPAVGGQGSGGGGTPSKAATAAAAAAAAAQSSAVSSAFAALLPALSQAFPADLVALISSLFRPETTVATLQTALAPRLMRSLTNAQSRVDYTENEVGKELANGRLVRLLIKLGFVCDRPAESVAAAHRTRARVRVRRAALAWPRGLGAQCVLIVCRFGLFLCVLQCIWRVPVE